MTLFPPFWFKIISITFKEEKSGRHATNITSATDWEGLAIRVDCTRCAASGAKLTVEVGGVNVAAPVAGLGPQDYFVLPQTKCGIDCWLNCCGGVPLRTRRKPLSGDVGATRHHPHIIMAAPITAPRAPHSLCTGGCQCPKEPASPSGEETEGLRLCTTDCRCRPESNVLWIDGVADRRGKEHRLVRQFVTLDRKSVV